MRQAQAQTTQAQARQPAPGSPARAEQAPAVSASAHVTVYMSANLPNASLYLTKQSCSQHHQSKGGALRMTMPPELST